MLTHPHARCAPRTQGQFASTAFDGDPYIDIMRALPDKELTWWISKVIWVSGRRGLLAGGAGGESAQPSGALGRELAAALKLASRTQARTALTSPPHQLPHPHTPDAQLAEGFTFVEHFGRTYKTIFVHQCKHCNGAGVITCPHCHGYKVKRAHKHAFRLQEQSSLGRWAGSRGVRLTCLPTLVLIAA